MPSPDFTFGAQRWNPESILSVDPTLRKRSGRRDLAAKVPRNLPAASAPERNVSKSLRDKLSRGLAVFGGGDERDQVQRASTISDTLGYLDPVEGLERAFVNAHEQLSGGAPATTADYVNLGLPAASLAAGPVLRAAGKLAPGWLTASRPVMDAADDAVEGAFAVRETPQLAARPGLAVRPRALPAPEPRLGLPNYYAPLPEHAVKPRGGQWLPPGLTEPNIVGPSGRYTTMWARPVEDLLGDIAPMGFNAEAIAAAPGLTGNNAVRDWIERNLAKYIKNEMGSPDDPLRLLDEQGIRLQNNYRGEVPWHEAAAYNIDAQPFGALVGPGAPEATGLAREFPWMVKQPVTNEVYGLREGALDNLGLKHLSDEVYNMVRLNSGLPDRFRLRPEQLQRLSVPDAVRRVHELDQWRLESVAEANAALARNPATHIFKEYPDDPKGMHWVELKIPENQNPGLPEGYSMSPTIYNGRTLYEVKDPNGYLVADYPSEEEAFSMTHRDAMYPKLREALKYEGDTMGHCVGGYCDDVASGRSRIFSLRDAKGEPHVTVETGSGYQEDLINRVPEEIQRQIVADLGGTSNYGPDFNRAMVEWAEKNLTPPDNIIQIKGKGNARPKDDYLPYVQDFVKSQQWGRVGDLGNTGLVKLPDGSYGVPLQ